MPLQIVRNDITKMETDAIVNAANETLLGGGGVDGCIHRAAGPALLAECRTLGGCPTGEAKITGAYNLPCRYVIHTVGPIWHGGRYGEKELLTSCYRKSLELAAEYHCETVAFPLISAGVYGYPKEQALRVAEETIRAFLEQSEQDMTVYIVVWQKKDFQIAASRFENITAYIDDHYVEAHTDPQAEHSRRMRYVRAAEPAAEYIRDEALLQAAEAAPMAQGAAAPTPRDAEAAMSLEEALKQMDESFSEMLLRKIDGSGMTDAQCYKKANIDRRLFSKIRSDRLYKPSKATAVAFAVALELSPEETADLLKKAGYALSHSNKFDIIVEYFIMQGNYNIMEINEALFAFDQSLLGA